MIGNDHVDRLVLHRTPELLAVFPFANGRTTFEFRRAFRNIFRRDHQVVGTRFRGYFYAFLFCFAQRR
jgi:hypothetical protein